MKSANGHTLSDSEDEDAPVTGEMIASSSVRFKRTSSLDSLEVLETSSIADCLA